MFPLPNTHTTRLLPVGLEYFSIVTVPYNMVWLEDPHKMVWL